MNGEIKRYGWICPSCGRSYSPSTTQCFYCGNEHASTSTTTVMPETMKIKPNIFSGEKEE